MVHENPSAESSAFPRNPPLFDEGNEVPPSRDASHVDGFLAKIALATSKNFELVLLRVEF